MEIPEIYDGTIVVKSAVHEPGDRAKVAVASLDRDVDPVGACVGMKGSRINSIIRELRGEKIDIVQWSEDPAQYAANALNPAKISKVLILDPAEKHMEVIVEEKQQSLAIGKKGQNVRLASRLIGWQIDVKSEEQKKQEVLSVMESLTSSSTSLSELEGISDRLIDILREAGIENVERILELGEEPLTELPGIGEKTAAKIMDAARDLFEEVEIEVPEGMDLPTAIEAAKENESTEEIDAEAETQPEPVTEELTTDTSEDAGDASPEEEDSDSEAQVGSVAEKLSEDAIKAAMGIESTDMQAPSADEEEKAGTGPAAAIPETGAAMENAVPDAEAETGDGDSTEVPDNEEEDK
jgi:N utilization substance protein A